MVERIRTDLPPMDETAVREHWDASADSWARQVRAGQDRYRELFNNPLFFAFVPDLAGRAVMAAAYPWLAPLAPPCRAVSLCCGAQG